MSDFTQPHLHLAEAPPAPPADLQQPIELSTEPGPPAAPATPTTGRRAYPYSPTAERSAFLHAAEYRPRHSSTVPALPQPFRLDRDS